jgi:hypothetical protein
MTVTTTIYKFKKGQETHLDEIYFIQSLDDGDWWQHLDFDDRENSFGHGDGDELVITRNITIEIKITT